MRLPSVTCVLCAYNYERYVGEAIDSALAQDYPAELLDILVIDDGSTDATPEVLKGYGAAIRVIRQPNAGLNAATQRGIEEARGDLIALLDADDTWLPGKLTAQVELLQRRPEVGMVFCDAELMDEQGRTFVRSYFRHHDLTPAHGAGAATALLLDNSIPAPTIVFRREHIAQVLPIRPEAPCQDWWLAVRLAEVTAIDYVPAPLIQVRVHTESMSAVGERLDPGTAAGRRILANLRSNSRFRRWMLRTLALETVGPAALRDACDHFLGRVTEIAVASGGREVDEVLVTADDVADRDRSQAAARAAVDRGDLRAAVRHAAAARGADPFDPGARRLLRDTTEQATAAGDAAPPPADDATAEERLEWAEERYAAGDADTAVDVLLALASESLEPGLLARVHGDLAVLAYEAGRLSMSAGAALEALSHDGEAIGPLELLAGIAAQEGDHEQAAHWLGRACAVEPGDASLWRALGAAEHARARWPSAERALETAQALEPLAAEDVERLAGARAALAAEDVELLAGARAALAAEDVERLACTRVALAAEDVERLAGARPAAAAPECPPAGLAAGSSERRGRVLICVDFFHPSVGGTERLAEGIGVALGALGWDVHVACQADRRRTAPARRGMSVHEVRERPRDELRQIVRRVRPDGVLAISDPYAWPVAAALRLAAGGPRRVVVPCINAQGDARMRASIKDLRLWRSLLEGADAVVHSSRAGRDAALNHAVGVRGVYVPNATEETPAGASLRARLDIDDGRPMLLMVANFLHYKNHLGLLAALEGRRGDYHVVFAGNPPVGQDEQPELTARREALMAAEPRLHLAGGISPELVAAGMREADLLLMPSLIEATPLVLLEAMSHRLPWIASPTSGAAPEWAGGLIAAVDRFGDAIDHLLADRHARSSLAAAGREHWEACFTYDVVAARYDALLRGAADLPDLPPPPAALAATDRERGRFFDALIAPRALAVT